ncbi:uncharacterized protein LOC116306827 [Actinia tenebrosa]|uniref:Uncharacterized protein LOC116306827 n=1 Tax=Actinia tenebrosa TaxID=6105 RepID=A0A6P8IZ73_ACTTE|nr:uncharacterized protein LOC116306827 [Actinia tenebrosa]
MAFDLRKEVEELRKRGASLGLNQDDIDYAILKSLGEAKPKKSTVKTPANPVFAFFKYLIITMAIIIALIIVTFMGLYIAASHDKQFGLLIGRTIADWQYPVVRMFRLAFLPLHQYFDLSDMYKWECIVQNPAFVQLNPECDICEKAVRVPIRSSKMLPPEAFKEKYFDPGFSVIVRDVETYGSANHTYGEFLDTYYEHQETMDVDACEFYLGGQEKKPKNLGELLEHWEHFKPEGHVVGWKFCYGKGFREIRKLYPRPYFVHSEGALEKIMHLLQPAGVTPTTVELPPVAFDNVWYAQVSGTTEVQLKPVEFCETSCKTHVINLIQGDVLFFTQQVWKASFTNRAQESAMIFVSSFA